MDENTIIVSIISFIGIISSGVISMFISQKYGRKNLKTSQYISVVTSERIKWIEKVREEFAVLISSVILHVQNGSRIVNYDKPYFSRIFLESANEYEIEEYENAQNKSIRISNAVKPEFKSALSKREIVEKSILLKLKLNSQEDNDIISILDNIIRTFSVVTLDVSTHNIEYDRLANRCQEMLKREWEKVKEETRNK